MKTRIAALARLALLTLLVFCSSCGKQGDAQSQSPKPQSASKQGNPHLKRGDDWLKLQDYRQAASEFSQAVTVEPANVEGHVGLIKSLLGLHRYDEAVSEIEVVRKLEASRAVEVAKLVETSLINLFNSNDSGMSVSDALSRLDLLRTIGSAQSVPLLKTLMGNSSERLAAKAESTLQALSPSDVEASLDALLDSSDTEVKTRTAKRLWKEKRSEKAGKVLLAISETEVKSAGRQTSEKGMSYEAKQAMEKGLENMGELGYGLAKEFYRKVITSSESYRWELVTACIKRIAAANDSAMKDDVVEMLRKHYMGDTKKIIGYSPTQEALDYLAGIGDKSFLPELKSALGYYFLSGDQSYCPATLSVLSKMDGKKWDSFYYFYHGGGWTEFGKLNLDINKLRGDFGGSGKHVVDHSPEDGASIKGFFDALGGKSGFSGSGNQLRVPRVEVIEADRIKWVCSITEGDSQNEIYQADVIFRGTGLAENAWLITKVENLQQKAARIGGSARDFLRSGKTKFDQKDYAGAIADYNKGILWRPNDNDLLRNRGWARAMKGDYDEAVADAEKAIAHAGMYGDQEALLLYGFAKLRKGDYDGAIAQFDSMISRNQQKATAYNWRGAAKEKKGDLDGAIADWKRAIDTDPNLKNDLLPKIQNASEKKNAPAQP